ncbi:EAL domain-containing protein [Salinarimonas rosea]|uniref:EAL domain-containing protein n=1 Tax=Salinarimonas rosea TaxID=552063 RepID=UPI000420054C|nr:EAL domain-containing protein [Salinarimonas rosea]
MRRRLVFLLVAALGYAATIAAIAWGASFMTEASERRQVQAIVDQVVTRSEIAIDRVVIALSDLLVSGHADCDAQTVREIQRAAFSVGSLTDVVLSAPGARCSGFSDVGLEPFEAVADATRHPARSPDFALLRVDVDTLTGLGIEWRVGAQSLVGLMSVDTLLFDMLPPALRSHASLTLGIGPGVPVAHVGPALAGEYGAVATAAFEARSERYPLHVSARIPTTALGRGYGELPGTVQLAGALFAALFAILFARAVLPPPSPMRAFDQALAEGAIVPFAQPIVSMASGRIVGCEVLARWIEPDGTIVPPARFIPLVETSGRSDALLVALLRRAAADLAPLLAVRPDFKVGFNVPPDRLAADAFTDLFLAEVQRAGLAPAQVVVEVTERGECLEAEAAREAVARLRRAGVGVAIDDAGTGHNGLAMIEGLGASTLKIDKLFVDRIDTDARMRAVVEMLVRIAREFDMTLVAEGVERAEQVAVLLGVGVRDGQGYLFGRPVPARELHALAGARRVPQAAVLASPRIARGKPQSPHKAREGTA